MNQPNSKNFLFTHEVLNEESNSSWSHLFDGFSDTSLSNDDLSHIFSKIKRKKQESSESYQPPSKCPRLLSSKKENPWSSLDIKPKIPIFPEISPFEIVSANCLDECSLHKHVDLYLQFNSLMTGSDYLYLSPIKVPPEYLTQKQLSSENGLWFLLKQMEFPEKKFYLLIELFEMSNDTKINQIVEFCHRKTCYEKKDKTRRDNLIEYFGGDVVYDGGFKLQISIHEQCAHRSKSPYGSPDTLFCFRNQIYELSENSLKLNSDCASNLIKVVAQGKANKGKKNRVFLKENKTVSKNPVNSAKSMMVAVLDALSKFTERFQTFDERLSKVENSIQLFQNIAELDPKYD